jgi:catechol 2,3-dioxygenase-like lactoylglutathione lyase family enzyme
MTAPAGALSFRAVLGNVNGASTVVDRNRELLTDHAITGPLSRKRKPAMPVGVIIHPMLKRVRDPRPAAAIGHVFLKVSDVAGAVQFLAGQGLRPIDEGDDFAVLELRGGTHLLLTRSRRHIKPRTEAPFDLMVDDIDAARESCKARGLKPSRIKSAYFHRSFTVLGPDGYVLTITSSHTGNRVV